MEKKNSNLIKQKAVFYVLFFLTFGTLMLVGTFKDLEIDKALFNYQNAFALLMEKYGMLPFYSVKLFAFSVLVAAYHKPSDALDIMQSFLPFIEKVRTFKPFKVIYFVIHHIIYAVFIYNIFVGSNETLNFVLTSACGGNLQDVIVGAGAPKFVAVIVWTIARIALAAVILFAVSRLNKETLKKLEFMAIAGLFLYEGMNIIIALKGHFHRIRFREMVAYSHGLIDNTGMSKTDDTLMPKEWVDSSSFYAYAPWYTVGNDYGIYSDSTSFPSGHTAAAAYSMLFPMLMSKMKNATKLFAPAFILSFAYTLTVGITRLIRGAHYMTDIAAGALIIFTLLILIMGIMNYLERYSENKIKRIKRKNERAQAD